MKEVEKMTKREHIAVLVLQSIIKNSAWIEFSSQGVITDKTLKLAEENSQKIAEVCVKYADALMTRLEEDGNMQSLTQESSF
ncbi:MAG TPA: hypothetical protein V6D37_04010 [Candidatus Sericytochromatia bacterium]|jgi:hypothetical protein